MEECSTAYEGVSIYNLLIGEEGQEYTFKNRSKRVIRITVLIINYIYYK